MKNPIVSVIMPCLNSAAYLREALESLRRQSFKNFEVIIVDGGSQDDTETIANSTDGLSLRFLRIQPKSPGISEQLNFGIRNAAGRFIARMDSDDICAPERFTKQVHFLQSNPSVCLVGSAIRIFGSRSGFQSYPIRPQAVVARAIFESPVAHPSVMFDLLKVSALVPNFYDDTYESSEDYHFFAQIIGRGGQIANLDEALLRYRVGAGQVTERKKKITKDCARRARESLWEQMSFSLTDSEKVELHRMAEWDSDLLQDVAGSLRLPGVTGTLQEQVKGFRSEFQVEVEWRLEKLIGKWIAAEGDWDLIRNSIGSKEWSLGSKFFFTRCVLSRLVRKLLQRQVT